MDHYNRQCKPYILVGRRKLPYGLDRLVEPNGLPSWLCVIDTGEGPSFSMGDNSELTTVDHQDSAFMKRLRIGVAFPPRSALYPSKKYALTEDGETMPFHPLFRR